MTTLRIEVGRHCGTTVEHVVRGLLLAGCMKHIEIDPSAYAFLPIDELERALECELFHVELRAWPSPPPPSLWRRILAWPRRAYLWTRRRVFHETATEQLVRAYSGASAMHTASLRESPIMAKLRKDPGGL